MRETDQTAGTVTVVRASVVTARLSGGVPNLYTRLDTGDDREIVVEVHTHEDEETVRGIALTSTQGLRRGARIELPQYEYFPKRGGCIGVGSIGFGLVDLLGDEC